MSVKGAQSRITQAVTSWEGVTIASHRFGGVKYVIGRREVGHIHGDHMVDIPYPSKVGDVLVAVGRAQPHYLLPETGWFSFYLWQEDDVKKAITLFCESYEIAQKHKKR